jgi:FtsH-binding integral membrane protein
MGIILCTMCIVMVPIFIIFPNRIVFTIICIVVILLISLFIIYDTRCIAKGEKYGLTYDEYIIGALLLYIVSLTT